MSPVHGVTADGSSPTIFTVLGRTARSHSSRYLAVECVLAVVMATLVLAWQLEWWPLALPSPSPTFSHPPLSNLMNPR